MRVKILTVAFGLSLSSIALAQSSPASMQQYLQTNLVADSTATAAAKTIDPNLIAAWGMAASATGPWWLSDNGNGLSTLYTGAGATEGLVVTIPTADPSVNKIGTPTGIVFNANPSIFKLSDGKTANFLYATQDGLIAGWNGGVGTTAQIIVNQSQTSMFTGLTIADAKVNGMTSTYLYVADFMQGVVDVFDSNFNHVPAIESAIASIPVPAGYAPLNVQNIGGNLYVSLAVQTQQKNNQVAGPGLGIVAGLTPEGTFIGTLETGSFLNVPWGVAVAPSDFGQYSHDLLVSNNGSGYIDVFNPVTGKYIAQLQDATNSVISINGLWGIAFGSDSANGGPATSLYFAASPGTGGLFGTLTPIQNNYGTSN